MAIVTLKEEPIKMDFNTFKARIVALAGELERLGNRTNTLFCGPDQEYDSMSRQTKSFWRAKLEIEGPTSEFELKQIQEKIMGNSAIQAKQGIVSKRKII